MRGMRRQEAEQEVQLKILTKQTRGPNQPAAQLVLLQHQILLAQHQHQRHIALFLNIKS